MDGVTWQTEAEQQADQGPPRWRRPLGIALGVVVALVLIGAAVAWWLHARQFVRTCSEIIASRWLLVR
jgi:hypothetical protein